ncbi:DUF1616 domain-containing protein [Kouleothrix sp.]|uniref:DUF1616 domain-containing protein n=1 Tax=Kouleothrix sp. TaxID=2779161 RepID=UPI00391D5695
MTVKPTTQPRIVRSSLRTPAPAEVYDLLLLIGAALLVPALLLLPLPWLRVPLGLATVLLAPGYALVAAIFPQRDDLDGVARAGLSFGLSVAVAPLLALLLDQLPWGIQPWPIAITLMIWITLWCAVALLRRAWLPAGIADAPAVPAPRGLGRAGARPARLLLGALALALVLGAGVYALAAPDPSARITEFYALGAQGLAEDYPREVAPGELMQVRLGVVNREGAPQRYRVEARAAGQLIAQAGPSELADGQSWEAPLRYALPGAGDDQQVDILLFRDDETTPYRQLRLWVNVRGQP